MLIVLPALFAIVFLGVQGALWFHARSVAIAAAQEGARAAAAYQSSAAAGIAAAADFVADVGPDAISDVAVVGERSATTATITVTGRSASLLPGLLSPAISQSASAPIEELTAP